MNWPKLLFISVIFCFLLLSPFIFDKNIFKQNDLDGNLVNLLYIKNSLLSEHFFPQWNPYLNQGLPSVSDPLNSYLYPIIMLPIIIFETGLAIKITYFLSLLLSVFTFYILLRHIRIEKSISFLLSLTF